MGQTEDRRFLTKMYLLASAREYWSFEASRARRANDSQTADALDADVKALDGAMAVLRNHHRVVVLADAAAELRQPLRVAPFEAAMEGVLAAGEETLRSADEAAEEYLRRVREQGAPAPAEPSREAARLLAVWNRARTSRRERRAARNALMDRIRADGQEAHYGHQGSHPRKHVEFADAPEPQPRTGLSLAERSADIFSSLAAGTAGWHPPSMWTRDLRAEQTTRTVEESVAHAAQILGFADDLAQHAAALAPRSPRHRELVKLQAEFQRKADNLIRDLVVPWATDMALAWALQKQGEVADADVQRLLELIGEFALEASGLGTPGTKKWSASQRALARRANAFLRGVPAPAFGAPQLDGMMQALRESRLAVAEAVFRRADETRKGNHPADVLPQVGSGFEIVYLALRTATPSLAAQGNARDSASTASVEVDAREREASASAAEATVRRLEDKGEFLKTMYLLEAVQAQLARGEMPPELADRLDRFVKATEKASEACHHHHTQYVHRDVSTDLRRPDQRARYHAVMAASRAAATRALEAAEPAITTYRRMVERGLATPPPEVTGKDERLLVAWHDEIALRRRHQAARAAGVASVGGARPTRLWGELIAHIRTRVRSTPTPDVAAPTLKTFTFGPAPARKGTAAPLSIAEWADVAYSSIAEVAVKQDRSSLWALRLDATETDREAKTRVMAAAHLTGFAVSFAHQAGQQQEAAPRVSATMHLRSQALLLMADDLFRAALAPWATRRAMRWVTEHADELPTADARRLINLIADSAMAFAQLEPPFGTEELPTEVISARGAVEEFARHRPSPPFRYDLRRAALDDALQPGRDTVGDAMVNQAVQAWAGAELSGSDTSLDSGLDLVRSRMRALAGSQSDWYRQQAEEHVLALPRSLSYGMSTRTLDFLLTRPPVTVAADRGEAAAQESRGSGASGLSATDGRRRPGHQRLLAASPLYA